MGIMPSFDDGRARNAARDNNVMGFHSRIPDTFLPVILGHAIMWFPDHRDGFNTFFWIGGSLGCISFRPDPPGAVKHLWRLLHSKSSLDGIFCMSLNRPPR
jgi:hypothetical protein